jgi:hypothetical protein
VVRPVVGSVELVETLGSGSVGVLGSTEVSEAVVTAELVGAVASLVEPMDSPSPTPAASSPVSN